MIYNSDEYEGDEDDQDVFGIMTFMRVENDPHPYVVKILLSDHIPDGHIQHLYAGQETGIDLYLVVPRVMVAKINDIGYAPMLQRALTLTAIELMGGTNTTQVFPPASGG